jgi:hypothetical protein
MNITTGGPGGTGSANADPDRFLIISMDAHKRLCSDDSDIVGAVMVHGTNTLADTVRNLSPNKQVAHYKLGLWR